MQQSTMRHLTLVTFTRDPWRAVADVLHEIAVDQQNNLLDDDITAGELIGCGCQLGLAVAHVLQTLWPALTLGTLWCWLHSQAIEHQLGSWVYGPCLVYQSETGGTTQKLCGWCQMGTGWYLLLLSLLTLFVFRNRLSVCMS